MIKLKWTAEGFLEHKEIRGCDKEGKASKSYWYYDLRTSKISTKGQKGDLPEKEMTQGQLSSVKKFLVPKAENSIPVDVVNFL